MGGPTAHSKVAGCTDGAGPLDVPSSPLIAAARAGDAMARAQLVETFMPLIASVTRTYRDGVVGSFGDLLADPLAEGEYERVLDAIDARQLVDLLSGLSDRERAIVRARHGLDGPERSLQEVGDSLGLSSERVRQLEKRALGKLAAVAAGRRGAA